MEFYHKKLGFEVVLNVEVTGQNGARYMEYFVNSGEKTKFTVYYGGPDSNCAGQNKAGISFGVKDMQGTYDSLVKKVTTAGLISCLCCFFLIACWGVFPSLSLFLVRLEFNVLLRD